MASRQAGRAGSPLATVLVLVQLGQLGVRHHDFGDDFRSWLQEWVTTNEGKGNEKRA